LISQTKFSCNPLPLGAVEALLCEHINAILRMQMEVTGRKILYLAFLGPSARRTSFQKRGLATAAPKFQKVFARSKSAPSSKYPNTTKTNASPTPYASRSPTSSSDGGAEFPLRVGPAIVLFVLIRLSFHSQERALQIRHQHERHWLGQPSGMSKKSEKRITQKITHGLFERGMT
jgi:hypothetical protein